MQSLESQKDPKFYSTMTLQKSLLKDKKYEDLKESKKISDSLQKRGIKNYSQTYWASNRSNSSAIPSERLPSFNQFKRNKNSFNGSRDGKVLQSDNNNSGSLSGLNGWFTSTLPEPMNLDMSRFKKIQTLKYIKPHSHNKPITGFKQGVNKLKKRLEINRNKLPHYIDGNNLDIENFNHKEPHTTRNAQEDVNTFKFAYKKYGKQIRLKQLVKINSRKKPQQCQRLHKALSQNTLPQTQAQNQPKSLKFQKKIPKRCPSQKNIVGPDSRHKDAQSVNQTKEIVGSLKLPNQKHELKQSFKEIPRDSAHLTEMTKCLVQPNLMMNLKAIDTKKSHKEDYKNFRKKIIMLKKLCSV
ncbi:unnamed protein product [Moneuplotes crassus]|uniref:Uncharacterized protein n=1 Tax=Euplotes crassus TaxID=5936 RepID=A0AAD1XEH0_EUPCR|nr:unnamed protein product [Moneuplotes crassus]